MCLCVCVQKELVAEEINNVQLSLRDSEAILVSPSVYTYIWKWTKIYGSHVSHFEASHQ